MDLRRAEGRREQGRRIQAALDDAGLSAAALAREIGCSRALVYQYLAGQVLAQPDRVQAIAELCGKPLAWFFSDEPESAAAAEAETARLRREFEAEKLAHERGRSAEQADALLALAAAHESGPDFAALRRVCERLVERSRDLGDPRRLAEAQFKLGNACYALGDYEAARAALSEATAGFREQQAYDRERAARQTLGGALAGLGERDRALAEFEAVLDSADPADLWRGRLGRADVFEALGRGEEALAELEAAEAALPDDSAERGLAELYLCAATANVYLLHDDFAAAAAAARRCLPLAEEQAAVTQVVEARLNLACAERYQGHWVAALEAIEDALRLARLTGDRERQATAGAGWAELLGALGLWDQARAAGKDALAAALALGSVRGEILAHQALSETYRRAGDAQEALYHARQGAAAAGGHRLVKLEASLRLCLALALRAGGAAGAEAELRRVAATADEIGARRLQAEAALALGGDENLALARRLADETGAFETQLAVALATGEGDALASAAGRLLDLREVLVAAGRDEALLEEAGRLTLLRESIRLLQAAGRTAEAVALRERAAWPPLDEGTGGN